MSYNMQFTGVPGTVTNGFKCVQGSTYMPNGQVRGPNQHPWVSVSPGGPYISPGYIGQQPQAYFTGRR